ncbi:MAG: redoxin domain-containing protein [Bacteroidetes bacterium]|nr:redoxin domain-containing protein [Bacteroidota bacterium]
MLRKILILTISIILLVNTTSLAGKSGYKIKVTIAGVSNQEGYLAYYYGDKQYIKDTVMFDKNGVCVFKGKEPLPGGIYLVVVSPSNNYFEMVVGDEQFFSLETDFSNMVEHMKITGSKENELFYHYVGFVADKKKKSDLLQSQLKNIEFSKDSIKGFSADDSLLMKDIRKQIGELDGEVKAYMESVVYDNPGMFYPKVLKSMLDPVTPDAPMDEAGNIDSTFRYIYYKKHYWDNIDLSDERMIRTPVYHNKLKKYIKEVTLQHYDSLIVESDFLLQASMEAKELFKYTLVYLLNYHAKSKIMGLDGVYVHLVENYYMKGHADWVSEAQMLRITTRAMKLKPILIGKIAPNLELADMNGKFHNLHKTEAKFTILAFWDPDCGHCKKQIPKLKKLGDKLKGEDVKVFAVCTEVEVKKWEKFIKEHDLNFINVADPYFRSNMRSDYDLTNTPVLFLLDRKKEIIAKRVSVSQLDSIIERLLKFN